MHPILFEAGNLTVYAYGIFMALAFGAAWWLARAEAARAGVDPQKFRELALVLIVAGLVGGHGVYVLFEWPSFADDPISALAPWRGGMVFYGGLATAAIAGYVYARTQRLSPGRLADVVAPALALGHAIGRLGCFLAGCCYGAACDAPWSVTYADPRGLAPLLRPLHPVQLYEAAANLALFLALLHLLREAHRRGSPLTGRIFGLYLAGYAAARFVLEFFRGDPRPFVGPLSLSQVLGVTFLILGLAFLRAPRKHRT